MLLFKMSKEIESPRKANLDDLSLIACLRGNDYVSRGRGDGPKKVIKYMKEYFNLKSDELRSQWVDSRLTRTNRSEGERKKFYMTREHFRHGAAFLIVPEDKSLYLSYWEWSLCS